MKNVYINLLYFLLTIVLSDEYIDTVVDSLSALNVKDNYCTVVYFSSLGGALKEIPRDSSPFLFKNAK